MIHVTIGGKQVLLTGLRGSLWQILDLQAVVVMAPFTARENRSRYFLDRQIWKLIAPGTKGGTQD